MHLKRTFDFSSFTVLIYTPSEFARSLVGDMCRALRFKSVVAKRDYDSAWLAFTSNPIDIIFGDVAAEEGCRLLKDVRNSDVSPNPHLPFIATALTSSPACITRARDLGATEFLRFPLSAGTLIERVVYVIEHPRVFVKCATYTGPDRRRKRMPYNGEERRKDAQRSDETPAPKDGEPPQNWKVQA
jgi:CheY-like chemotaxis protein